MKVDFANLKRYAYENQKLQKTFNNEFRIVFFGDSITEFWTPKNSTLFHNTNYINRGISGQTTSQMVFRFQQDVIDIKPSKVIILAGINDLAENTGPISIEKIFENTITMVELANANKIKILLCSILPATAFSWRPDLYPADKIIQLNLMLKKYAFNKVIPFVDYYSAMVDSKIGLNKKYSDDGVHPNNEGYKVMEKELKSKLTL